MTRTRACFEQLRNASPKEAGQLIYRKAVYRRVRMGRYGCFAREATHPRRELELRIETWGPDRYEDVFGTNDSLRDEDMANFRRQNSRCIVVLDGEHIAASSWMTSGDVYVHELGRSVHVPDDEHFSCRSWVSPLYRGRSLFSHMVAAYMQNVAPSDEVWGFVYYWNIASVRSLADIGWQYSGDYWTSYLFGRQRSGQTRYAARSPFDGDDVYVP